MRVTLLGTGSADRFPNPWCRCARCAAARAAGRHRGRTSVLVDDRLLIDPGPDCGASGADLTRVESVLLTHLHPDHVDPMFLLAWSWSGSRPLQVVGPAEAVAACRAWVDPAAPVRFVVVGAGSRVTAAGFGVRALPAAHSTRGGGADDGTAVLYEVTGTDARLLYACDTGAVPHAQLEGRFDGVLLDCTFGDWVDHPPGHLALAGFATEVAQLRAADRLAPRAAVVAVHLSHHTPTDVDVRLADCGATAPPDGTVLDLGGTSLRPVLPAPTGPRTVLVTGGARSGKSTHAEALAAAAGLPVTYVATAPRYPDDPEWVARIALHRARRPADWAVVESSDVAAVLRGAPVRSVVLVDCLTLWLTAVIDGAAAWEEPAAAQRAVEVALADLASALTTTRAAVVLVTNEVGSGVVPAHASGRLFRDLLGRVNVTCAAACAAVDHVVCGIATRVKGDPT